MAAASSQLFAPTKSGARSMNRAIVSASKLYQTMKSSDPVAKDEQGLTWIACAKHSCKDIFEFLYWKSSEMSPEVIGGLYRLIHCRRCGDQYRVRLANLHHFADWYIRMGGNLKEVYQKKPKIMVKDLPSIKAALARGVKSDPKLKLGSSAEHNAYLIENLGQAAIFAGLINGEFVKFVDPLFTQLINSQSYDVLPRRPIIYEAALQAFSADSLYSPMARCVLDRDLKNSLFSSPYFLLLVAHYHYYNIMDLMFLKDNDKLSYDEMVKILASDEAYLKYIYDRNLVRLEHYRKKYPGCDIKLEDSEYHPYVVYKDFVGKTPTRTCYYERLASMPEPKKQAIAKNLIEGFGPELAGLLGGQAVAVRKYLIEDTAKKFTIMMRRWEPEINFNCDYGSDYPATEMVLRKFQ